KPSGASAFCRPPSARPAVLLLPQRPSGLDRKSTRLNSSHLVISYAVFCLNKKNPIVRHSSSDAPRVRNGGPAARHRQAFRSDLQYQNHHARPASFELLKKRSDTFYDPLLLAYFFLLLDPATTELYTLSLHDALPI